VTERAPAKPARHFSSLAAYAAASICLLLMLGALWIIPWRMAFEPGGSYYTFGYIPDEIFYAQRLQPLLPETTPGNPLNGLTDPRLVSQFYLEDACRAAITLTGIDVIAFFWVWRIAFPLVLFFTVLLLARKLLLRPARPWSSAMVFATAVASWAGMYFLYEVLTEPLPLHCWIDRVPTCIEYVLSLLLAGAALFWCLEPNAKRGALVAVAAALLVYMRPYLAVPWIMALALLGIWLLASRRLKPRALLGVVAVGIAALVPWLIAARINGQSQTHRELMLRYFAWPDQVYKVHDMAALHVALAIVIGLCALKVQRAWQPLLVCCAMALAILPFICGRVPPVAREMLRSDRFGSFYIVVLICTTLLLLRARVQTWRGRFSWWQARRLTLGACTATACFAASTAVRNLEHDLGHPPGAHYNSMVRENDFIPAYLWLRANSPADSLVAVDDGYDWTKSPDDPEALFWKLKDFTKRNELFHIVARRRVLYTDWMMYSEISNADLDDAGLLQRGLFGMTLEKAYFLKGLRRLKPSYVLWRKTPCLPVSRELAPIPRGYGVQLKQMSEVVYEDTFCEIWKVYYSAMPSKLAP